jgi:23S rRNA (cytosine1962-C5)-methyltransferase
MSEPAVRVAATIAMLPERHRRVRSGHPWAYSNELAMSQAAKALDPGSLVRLDAANGAPLGLATFNPRTLIAARLLSRDVDETIDAAFFVRRLESSLRLRELLFERPFYRLIHAEADLLPGAIVDRYGDDLVVQLNTAGMARLEAPLLQALQSVLAPRAILLRNDSSARELEGLAPEVRVAHGTIEGPVVIEENGASFPIDLMGGQKTGWFFDQRDNRAAVARLAHGADLLDLFTYGGGFAIEAAVAGARRVTLVDRSKPALARALEAAALNHVADRCHSMHGDALEIAERLGSEGQRFDIVVADPPAFVKSRKDLAIGLRAYRKLARDAASLVRPGGFLFVASCSHNVEPASFLQEVASGLAAARRSGRLIRQAGAAPDHPVHPFLPESAYLKALLFQLD